MPHLDPEDLALAALGEPLDATSRAHLAACAGCAREVASLAAAVAVARDGSGDASVPPPDGVWVRVRDELGLAADVTPGDATPSPAAPGGSDEAARPAGAGAGPDASRSTRTAEGPADAPAAGAGPARRRGPWLAAAAAGLVVGAVAGGVAVSAALRGDAETVVAEVRLDALPGWSATGDAQLEEDAAGHRTLVVRLADADADGFRQVWLLDTGATRLVSLGVLDGDEGRFVIPDGLDLAEFPVVDVSAEPFDGDPAHSGDSIVRGELAVPA
ncbi:anti-sigma factor [Cellulomonas sp. ACRRI]|uniref:anti-sigma factor n=1 Tax=Cellulomonas sp. ACRRI TaxID=2918188 RepID=UPI001EF17379|nr:anti-sigma factor [Cellulomonas sp. ACRRI]MCG7288293.1 anti-sigma factor [Cellulomonas sp. ACRRI]